MSAWSQQVVKLVTGGLLGLVLLSGRSGAMEPESRLEGWVRLASGQPAAGVQVRLFDLTDPRRSVGTTANEEGYFALAAPRLADARPQGFALLQNYPNPFNPSTIIPYQLPAPTHVRLEVFNVLGQHIATLVDREQPAGWHTVTWHGTDAAGRAVAAGLYLYRIRGTGPSETRRMVLVDGPVSAPGMAVAIEPPTNLAAPEPTYGLTVSGRDVVTHVDPDFQVGVGPVEIVVEARATSPAAMKATTSDRIWGDVDANGQVDIFDALLVGLYSLDPSIAIPNNGDIALGDVNRDGHIDITDSYLIATYSVNPTDPSLPVGDRHPGDRCRRGQDVLGGPDDGQDPAGQPRRVPESKFSSPPDWRNRLISLWIWSEDKMYWTDRLAGNIWRAHLDGTQVEVLLTKRGEVSNLALDLAGGKMYWTDGSWRERKIQRANLDGTQVEVLLTKRGEVSNLALDRGRGQDVLDGRKLEGAQDSTGKSRRNPRSKTSSLPDLFQIAGLVLDVAGGKMYWTDYGTNKIHRANLDGSRVEALVTTGLDSPWGLGPGLGRGQDVLGRFDHGHRIHRANLNGSQVEELLRLGIPGNPGSLVLVPSRGEDVLDGRYFVRMRAVAGFSGPTSTDPKSKNSSPLDCALHGV